MKIIVICGMQDYKVQARLKPIIEIDAIEEIFLIRRMPIEMPKVKSVSPPEWMRRFLVFAEIYRFLSIIWICLTRNIEVLYAIYFVPHGIYAAVVGPLLRRRVIQELIGTDRPKVMNSRMFLWLLKQAEWIGIRGTSSKKELINLGIPGSQLFSPIAVNALDFELFKPNPVEKVYDLIYCGRLEEVKQVDIIIRAIGALKQTHPSLKAVVIGDGSLWWNLQSLAEDLGLKSSIYFAGDQPNAMIPDFLNQSRIFVMASAFEGLPVAMLEALSCGLPVLMPDVGDIRDVAVDGENACLIHPPNSTEMVSCLDKMLSNEEYYRTLEEGALRTRELFINEYSDQRAQEMWRSVLFRQ
jgi:glycosyltransferase involved in cell wall biosynthesis